MAQWFRYIQGLGNFFSETLYRSHCAVFKKELKGYIPAIVVEPNTNATLFNQK